MLVCTRVFALEYVYMLKGQLQNTINFTIVHIYVHMCILKFYK